jgi:hypothetical protein
LIGCRFDSNGKQGMVSVGQGDYWMQGCGARGNASTDLLFLINNAAASTVDMQGNVGALVISCDAAGTPSTITGKVANHRGPISCKANVDIVQHRCTGAADNALNVDGGTVTAEDVYYVANTRGVNLTGGALTLKTGNILRNTTGMRQTAGTLTLDSAQPVNVFGNTTQFSGVGASDQALTVAVSAV